ncbi:hypothetical protein MRS76_22330 [Rhizobiaceae bacterium n13]|uniref:Uncharacterized protein n=1 Tax=Ferirhizobium litorale TaxID=2927786 RepID=A0AAE3QE28_9HYPH|nr:hypothetical protein [Fererhizobium litorale]MDI7864672.1 hypothetical protein [Fererhizobium litorale]MDI7922163.1 hypothetical protein [Fererhizobium litorale]
MTSTKFLSAVAVLGCLLPASASFAADAMSLHATETSAMAERATTCQTGRSATCKHMATSGAMKGEAIAAHAMGATHREAMSGGAMAGDHMKPHK